MFVIPGQTKTKDSKAPTKKPTHTENGRDGL